jgi:hypothetical protein
LSDEALLLVDANGLLTGKKSKDKLEIKNFVQQIMQEGDDFLVK